MLQKVRVGVVGCGAVSNQYLDNAAKFPILEIVALADLIPERCHSRAKEFNLPGARICTTEQLMKDKSVEVVLNLTWPKAHLPVTMAAIRAGKHVYSEKPLGVGLGEGKKILAAAAKKSLRVGCAPDTFLGSGIQTARKAVDDGLIGRVIGFTAFMMNRGMEMWHPNPPFFYAPGGGPMLDMGPYYLTALMNIIGPIKRVSGMAAVAIPQRTITHKNKDGTPGPMHGQQLDVTTPDHICGLAEFENGAVGSIITSFAVSSGNYDGKQPITIHGTEGSLRVLDPNHFDGPVHVRRARDDDWVELPPAFVTGYGRAVGLADMAYGIRTGRGHRANLQQAFAALEAMQGFLDSAVKGTAVHLKAEYQRPAAMPAGLPFGILDE